MHIDSGMANKKKIIRGASQNYTYCIQNKHSNTGGSTTDTTEPSCRVLDCVAGLCAFNLSVSDMYQCISKCFYLYMFLYASACRRDTSAETEFICFPAGQVKLISSLFIIRLLPPPPEPDQ